MFHQLFGVVGRLAQPSLLVPVRWDSSDSVTDADFGLKTWSGQLEPLRVGFTDNAGRSSSLTILQQCRCRTGVANGEELLSPRTS